MEFNHSVFPAAQGDQLQHNGFQRSFRIQATGFDGVFRIQTEADRLLDLTIGVQSCLTGILFHSKGRNTEVAEYDIP